MNRFKTLIALVMVMCSFTPLSAQFTGLSSDTSFANSAGQYGLAYYGSGGASYWHSLWAVPVTGIATPTTTGQQLVCKSSPDCSSLSNPFDISTTYTTSFTTGSNWVFGLWVQPSGATNTSGSFWLYSDASLNPYNAGYLHYFPTGGVRYDDRTTILASTAGTSVIGWEDLRGNSNGLAGGDRDFNDFIFSYELLGSSQETEVTPEPATMALMATGLVGLFGAGRRKKIV